MKNAVNPLDLKEENAQLKGLLSAKEARIQTQSQHIQQLEEYIINLRHQQYGASSEVNPQQAGLFDEPEALEETDIADESDSVTVASHTRKAKPRVSIPADLPREEIVHDLADADKVCPNSACEGQALKIIGTETSEQLDVIPAQVKVLRHIRKKYACPCCEQHIVTANNMKHNRSKH